MRIPQALALASCLMVASALAGCVSEEQATAKELQPYAEEIALTWASDARLHAVIGVEGSSHDPRMAEHAMMDPLLGDGRMELWQFSFISANKIISGNKNTTLDVAIDRAGKVVWQHEMEIMPHLRPQPLWEYTIDSDAAARIANQANQGIGNASRHPDGYTIMELRHDDHGRGLIWFVSAQTPGVKETRVGGMVLVDALSGEIRHNLDWANYASNEYWET